MFTVPGPFGSDIGQLADVMCWQARDRSPDAMDVVPQRGRVHVCRHLDEEVPGAHRIGAADPAGKYHRQPHMPASWPMIRGLAWAHHGTKGRPRTSASARDTTRPTRARA